MAYFFSALALLISVASFFYLSFYVRRRTAIERIPEDAKEAVRQIIDEIDRITDRDSRLVEERVNQLKALLEETDRRIGVLSHEVESRDRRDAAYAEAGKHKNAPPPPTPTPTTMEKEEEPSRAAVEMALFLKKTP
ncbi:MAG: hypothetical protein LBS82_05780 [Spirochaetaceae bacterium]|jgi:hypothetical protein|nr:hypothetical protein [Spirochaetaceae bacterium]